MLKPALAAGGGPMRTRSQVVLLLVLTLCGSVHAQKASAPAATPVEPKTPRERAWETLLAGVAEDKGAERSDAITALGAIGPHREVARLIEAALDDKNSTVRQVAAATLGEMKSRGSIPRLRRALDDESAEVSFSAARALWEMGDRSGREIFVAILNGDRKPARGVIQSRVRDVKQTVSDPKALTMIGIKQGAGALLGPFALGVSVVEEFTRDGSAPARALCADVLSGDRNADSLGLLLGALEDKNWVVRAAAARALGIYGNPAVLPRLEQLLKDDKDAVKYMAAAAIVRLSPARR